MDIGSFLFGGGGGFQKEYGLEKNLKYGATSGIANRLGAKTTGKKDEAGHELYDWSGVGAAPTLESATSGYDFSPQDEAINKFRNPYQFNFESLPEEYARNQYSLWAKDVRREGAGALQSFKNTIGNRRPDLLFKGTKDLERQQGEQLGELNLGIRNKMLEQQSQLGKEQQLSQADENRQMAGALASAGGQRTELQNKLLQGDRAQSNIDLQTLVDYYTNFLNTRRGAGVQNKKPGIAGGLITAGIETAGKFA